MPNFDQIIKNAASVFNLGGAEEVNPVADSEKRQALITALNVRGSECEMRFKVAVSILALAVAVLLFLALFEPTKLGAFKDVLSIIGGGSIIGLVTYIISLRDELTKIKQNIPIIKVMDMATVGTMLLAIANSTK
jgi:hypothetical protein